jgi:hypothetical protein
MNVMSFPFRFRAALAAGAALAALGFTSAAQAETCTIQFSVVKAGWVLGASGGSGRLRCHGHTYPISIGGLSYGIMIGASHTSYHGHVSHIHQASDVAGVYGAAGAGAAVGMGAQFITLRNEKGAVLTLAGHQVGLQVNADLSGLSVSMGQGQPH